MDKTFAYWTGWMAATRTTRDCPFQDPADRQQWADGFAAAVGKAEAAKVWWKSRTLQVTGLCLVAGVMLIVFSRWDSGPSGNVMMGAGSGLTLKSVIDTFLRVTTSQPLSWSNQSANWTNYSN